MANSYIANSASSGTAYVLNNNFLKVTYLKGGWMKMKEPVEPANQLARVHRVLTVGNMTSRARGSNAANRRARHGPNG